MADFPFDALIFDLDGTLVATDQFWCDAARAGALAAFKELRIERELPSNAEWMGMVGLPIDEAFDDVFSDLPSEQIAVVMEHCLEEQYVVLRGGGGAMLPGVAEALSALQAKGVRLGIASNCEGAYLELMMKKVGLEKWIEEGRCLDSPGISNKADMVEDLLLTFDTRSAVMVGDRITDRDAGWANGLPHVHLSRGYAVQGEEIECEAVIEHFDELLPTLAGRQTALQSVIRRLDLGDAGGVIGVSGATACGKTLFARDLGRELAASGVQVRVLALDPMLQLAQDGQPRWERNGVAAAWERLAGEWLIVEGLYLKSPAMRTRLDRLLILEASDELLLRRVAGRDGRLAGLPPVERARFDLLPAQRAFDEQHAAKSVADLVLDGGAVFGP